MGRWAGQVKGDTDKILFGGKGIEFHDDHGLFRNLGSVVDLSIIWDHGMHRKLQI